LEQSPLREAAEEMDTEHRQASAEIGTYGFQGKRTCNKVVGSSSESLDSPQSEISGDKLVDLWNESLSHLFPTLV